MSMRTHGLYQFVAEKRAALMRFEAALTRILMGESAAVVPLALTVS
jgi:hypothetical protein